MTKYTADKFELRVATTEAGLPSAPTLSGWRSIDINTDQGLKVTPVGIGSRLQTVDETLLTYAGSAEGWDEESAVAGSSDALTAFGMFQQAALTPLYLELKNKTTGRKITIKKVKGDPGSTIDSPEDYEMWSWDFKFEDISKS